MTGFFFFPLSTQNINLAPQNFRLAKTPLNLIIWQQWREDPYKNKKHSISKSAKDGAMSTAHYPKGD
jgi:hypothetical protein